MSSTNASHPPNDLVDGKPLSKPMSSTKTVIHQNELVDGSAA